MLCMVLVVCVRAADPTIRPKVVTDDAGSANSANENSDVYWAPIANGDPYVTNTEYDDGGLQLLFDLTHSFLNTIQPKDFPVDIINGVVNGTYDIQTNYKEPLMFMLGYAICVAIGILFVIIMPIVGCCFCCCRLCNNCGGKMHMDKDKDNNCLRVTYSVILFILTVLVGVGMACTYITNDRMSVAIENLRTVVSSNLEDADTYLTNTVNQLNRVKTNAYFTVDVIERDLDNRGAIVGVPVKQELAVQVQPAVDAILALDTRIGPVSTSLFGVESGIATVKAGATTLNNDLTDVTNDIVDAKALTGCGASCQALDTSNLAMDVNFDNLPDISAEVTLMQDVASKNLTAMALEGKKEFDEIPQRVTNETKDVVTDMKSMLQDFKGTVNDAMLDVTNLTNTLDLEDVKNSIEDYRQDADAYDKYRWYAGVALTCTILLVVVLQLLGLVMGCGGHKNVDTTQRKCMSNSGGDMLIAATFFIFFFSWLLMLLTTISFLIGGSLYTVVCRPLMDPEYTVVKDLLDKPNGILGDGYFLGNLLFNNNTIPLTVSGILQGCKDNGTAYEVLKLSNLFDLEKTVDYKKSVDIDTELDKMSVDLSDVKILSADTEQQLRDLSDAVGIDYAAFQTELAKETTQTDLSAFATNLRAVANDGTNSDPAKQSLLDAADALDDMVAVGGSYASVRGQQTQLLTDVNGLETSTSTIPGSVNTTIDNAKTAETYIQTQGGTVVSDQVRDYAARIVGVADSFVNDTLDAVKYEIGRCRPVWNLWESVVHNAICRYTVDDFNGFWCGLGWAIFFMVPSLIFNVKLAKYLRRMKSTDGFDDVHDHKYPTAPPPYHSPHNKVFHQDQAQPPTQGYGQGQGYPQGQGYGQGQPGQAQW